MKYYIYFLLLILLSCETKIKQEIQRESIPIAESIEIKRPLEPTPIKFEIKKNLNDEGYTIVTTGLGISMNIDSIKKIQSINLEVWYDSTLTSSTFTKISKLDNIHSLRIDLDYTGNSYIEGLDQLKNIKTLDITHLSELYLDDLNQLQNIEHLSLELPIIKTFPTKRLNLTNLKSFRSSLGDINTITPEIHHMQSLKSITFSKSKVENIPTELSTLKNLETLVIGGSWLLDSIPNELAALENLKTLNLFRNKISYIPNGIINLKSLKLLNINDNQLSREQADSIRASLPKCKVIYYRQNMK